MHSQRAGTAGTRQCSLSDITSERNTERIIPKVFPGLASRRPVTNRPGLLPGCRGGNAANKGGTMKGSFIPCNGRRLCSVQGVEGSFVFLYTKLKCEGGRRRWKRASR